MMSPLRHAVRCCACVSTLTWTHIWIHTHTRCPCSDKCTHSHVHLYTTYMPHSTFTDIGVHSVCLCTHMCACTHTHTHMHTHLHPHPYRNICSHTEPQAVRRRAPPLSQWVVGAALVWGQDTHEPDRGSVCGQVSCCRAAGGAPAGADAGCAASPAARASERASPHPRVPA